MSSCPDCPRFTVADGTMPTRAQCCMDDYERSEKAFTLVLREREEFRRNTENLLLRIPGRSAASGEVTHKKFADMNRKERRAFLSGRK